MKKDYSSTGQLAQVINGDSDQISNKLTSLLASKDRDYLLSPNGNQVKVSSLDGKITGIYFSANWYPPCRNFNQALVDFYLQLKQTVNNSNFEIIYVSSDEDTAAFDTYRETMPWLAIPFSDLETKKALNRRFDVEGIPCLVILQPNDKKDEETLFNGVELVHRYGAQAFPFTKERLEQLHGEERERHENQNLVNLLTNSHRDFLLCHPGPKQVPIDTLAGKTVGLYFSAEWCTPCTDFTPKLISIYQKINQDLTTTTTNHHQSQTFEIVFVSCDNDQSSFDTYFATMPWSALPFGDESAKNLVKHFDVKVIPSLVILGPDGKTVTLNGRNLINLYRESCYPFTEDRIVILEKELEEKAKSLPSSVFHSGHRHELSMVSDGNGGGLFICCDCDEQGSGWAYLCLECGYEIHPKCARTRVSSLDSLPIASGPGEWECSEVETNGVTSQGLNKVTALIDFGGDKGK